MVPALPQAGCNPDAGHDIDQIGKRESLPSEVVTRAHTTRCATTSRSSWMRAADPLIVTCERHARAWRPWMYLYDYSARRSTCVTSAITGYPIQSKDAWTWRSLRKRRAHPKELVPDQCLTDSPATIIQHFPARPVTHPAGFFVSHPGTNPFSQHAITITRHANFVLTSLIFQPPLLPPLPTLPQPLHSANFPT